MKKIYSILAIMAFSAVLSAAPTIFVVDMQEVHKNYFKAKAAAAQIQSSVDMTKAELQNMEKLRQAEIAKVEPIREKLQNPALTDAAKKEIEATEVAPIAQAVAKIEQDMRNLQTETQQKLQQNAQQISAQHRKEILVVVDAIAAEKNADFVIEKATCYYSKDASSITEEVIAKLNENAPAEVK